MGFMTKDQINVSLFDEVKKLRAENEALKRQLALAEMIADSAETYIQEGRFIAYCKETDTLRKQKEQLAKGGE